MSTLDRSKSLRRTKSCAADYRKPKDVAGSFAPAMPSSSAARSAAASAFLASANLPPLPPMANALPEVNGSLRRTQSVRFVGNARAARAASGGENKEQGIAPRKRSQSVSLAHQPQDQILSKTLRAQDGSNDTLRTRLSRAKSILAADRLPVRVDASVSSNSPAAVALAREQFYATEQPVTQNLNRTTSVRTSRSIRSLRRSVRSSHIDANAASNQRGSRPPRSTTRFKRFFKKIFGLVEEVDLCLNPESDIGSADVISDQIVPPIDVDPYVQDDSERLSHVRNFSRPSRVSSWTDNSTAMPSRHSFQAGMSIRSVNDQDSVSNWVRSTSGPRGGSLYQEPMHSYVTHAGHDLDVRRVYTALRGHVDGMKDISPAAEAEQRDSSLKTMKSDVTIPASPSKMPENTLDNTDLEEEPLTPTPRQRRAREIKPAFFPKPARVRPSSLSPHRDNHYEREAFSTIMSPSVYSEHDVASMANHWKDDSPGLATVIMSSKVPRASTTPLQPHPSIESLHWSSFLASNISRLEQQKSEHPLRDFSMVTRDLENTKTGTAARSPEEIDVLDNVEPLSTGRARQISISPLAEVMNASNAASLKKTLAHDGKRSQPTTQMRDSSRSTVRRSLNDGEFAMLSGKASFGSRSSMQRQIRHSPERIARLKRSYGHGLNTIAAASTKEDADTSPPRLLMQQYLNARNIELSETPRGNARISHVDENMDDTQRAFLIPVPFSIFPSTYRNPVVDDTVTKTKVQAQVTQQRVGREESDTSLQVNYPGSFRPRRNEEFRDYEVDDRTTRRADINIEVERGPKGREADIDNTERQYRRKFQPNYESDIDLDAPAKNIHIHSETLRKPESDESKMGYYDDAGNYHSFRRGLERAAERVLHPLRTSERRNEVIVDREEVTVSGRRGPSNVVSIPCHHVRVGDLLILQGHICQVIRISTSAQTGQHRYLGVDLFTKELHEELSTITTPGPNVVVQSMYGPVFKQYRVLDIRGDGRVVAMTESGEVKQNLPVIDQNELHERIGDAFADGRGSIRVLVINDGGNELAVDYRVIHGSRL